MDKPGETWCMRAMRICAVSPYIAPALAELGHEVLRLWPEEPLFDLEAELAERGFKPDLILQQESLGQRVALRGLSRFGCPKVFWSMDTHLNLFWQRHYLRLFDGVLTPHLSMLERQPLQPGQGAGRGAGRKLGRLAMAAPERPWRPFGGRARGMGFVGRVTEHRPVRKWLTEFLAARYGAELADGIPFEAMLDFYQDTRIAPNESLLGEVNYRLMEAAGCGCLVLTPKVGPDQDELFTPGREVETYAHALELRALLDHYLARPEEAERLGRAAWERIRREHLMRHRAEALLAFAADLPTAGATGIEAETASWLSLAHMARAGLMTIDPRLLERRLAALPQEPEVLAARLALAVEQGWTKEALALCRAALAGECAGELDAALAGSMAGIRLDDWSLARGFWLRHAQARGNGRERAPLPENPARLCLAWAGELAQADRAGSGGFAFDPALHLPQAAVECLYLAQRLAPDDLDISRRLAGMTATLRGHGFTRMGHLAHLALHNPRDWRTGLALGMAGLKACRLEVGLADLAQALKSAREQGKEAAFFGALESQDPKGYALAALLGRG